MPMYNAEKYLRDAIRSVLSQDYANWELLIVDDGSTDGSLILAKAFNDERISILSQKNHGVSHARNTALKVAKGGFFCFLDADDLLPVSSLSSRLACFSSPDICFADGCVEIFNSDSAVALHRWHPRRTSNHLRSLVRLDGKCFFGPTWMVKNLPSVRYRFDESLTHGEELLFYMSYAHLGGYAFTSNVVLKYRRTSASSMSNLIGLANGYSMIRSKLRTLPAQPSITDRIIFGVNSRKVMFLSFLRSGRLHLAFKYLLVGAV